MEEKKQKKVEKKQQFMTDAAGNQVPLQYVKSYDKARDRYARRIEERFVKANAYLARVKADTLKDIEDLRALDNPDGKKLGGIKGNVQFQSFDGLIRVNLHARSTIEFDDRFHRAQELIFDFLNELTSATGDQDVAEIIRAAFKPSASGMLSKTKIVGLFRLKIEKSKWQEAMQLLRECQFVKSGKVYLECDTKPTREEPFTPIPLDIAAIDPAD